MQAHNHVHQNTQRVRAAILTISDTRTLDTDVSGEHICTLLKEEAHTVTYREITKDDSFEIEAAVRRMVDEKMDVILTTGGTGITKRDVTIETIRPLLDREMVGFGELFRYVSFTEDIGPAAMLSRALAGRIGDTIIFSMPGSRGAVDLAMTRLILPELSHIVWEATR
ncbi:MAG: MogA/MoaB family molybdenum cofactor biosynthesis protein [Exiguobacterium sp.]|uniref:Molybdenum cofactor biosynthesis protein B n=1 Tax=Exiguobacterium sp. (strain ATCC BAA-1283 / AT1b) TaxID=360911 RepID=C4L0H3_EXISA|nr:MULTISPECIES: MogA/MoaB family molybdenum cofactor biosynthesis protein [Exiguobacterium]MDX5322804.1 MogA/MoaB family molybdenum cofactor biosynthesis protein [Exiguobacterium sp.]ACQ70836.1 molybdenum cofactor synthesis domain protein [Exiguobacterium sp. AT1b]MDT0193035.1 MogA/MoaB family molybdenum cofactor biosynthesis protein [Exiguobacterium sp. BG5(2022)]MDX5424550.1 MogA/MoaB family molybdenum cofactor biosynthesis protein [Exiguobacterium sp.]MDX6772047.1 MogA/MoaB family molybden